MNNNNNNETVNIELSPSLISLWKENDETKYSVLQNELENSHELVAFLCRYQKDRWTVDIIDHIEVINNPNELHISYTINYYSGCKDLDKDDDEDIVVKYNINLVTEEIEIIGEPIPEERSTLDEF